MQCPDGGDYGHHMSKAAANMAAKLVANELKGKAMVGISDVKGDAVNFRDREGGAKEATAEGIPKKRKLHGHTETQLYGSSWK